MTLPNGVVTHFSWVLATTDKIQIILPSTGGLVAVYTQAETSNANLSITNQNLNGPFEGPPPPAKLSSSLLPVTPTTTVVGFGFFGLNSQIAVIREQYWIALTSSISVAPGETKQCAYTVSTGVSRSETDSKSIDASGSVSASAGWGPLSGSISASLSVSSSKTQTVELREETTTSVVETYTNDASSTKTNIYINWQLMDRISLIQQPPNALPASPTASQLKAYIESLIDYFINLINGTLNKGVYVIGNSPTITKLYSH